MQYAPLEAAGAPEPDVSSAGVIYDAGVALWCLNKMHHVCDGMEYLFWCTVCGYIECTSASYHGRGCGRGFHFVRVR